MNKIKEIYYNIKRGIANLYHFRKVIWNYRAWDYSYTERILKTSLEAHYKRFLTVDHLVDLKENKHCLQSLRIALLILQRREDNWYIDIMTSKGYFDKDYILEDIAKLGINDIDYIKEQLNTEARDWKIFCNIMNKYYESWWD